MRICQATAVVPWAIEAFCRKSGARTTDTAERGRERLIGTGMIGAPCDPGSLGDSRMADPAVSYRAGLWIGEEPADYDREH